MPKDTADVVATSPNPATIVIGVDSGIVTDATLNGTPLVVGAGNQISIPPGQFPSGDSYIVVTIIFAPGDPDANITIISGPATLNPPGFLDHTLTPAAIYLFGE